jgi:AraC family transcriptional regulator
MYPPLQLASPPRRHRAQLPGIDAMTYEPLDAAYVRRIERVIEFICAHLEEDLSVERLSVVAGFSKFHFHRQFSTFTGFSVAQFVRLMRLKRAAYQLVFEPARSIMDIAFDAGFSTPESFSRAFKDVQEQTPTEFRRLPRWGGWANERRLPTPTRTNSMNPDIIQFETTRIAVLEHEGPPDTLMTTVTRFIQWRRASGDSPVATCRTFGIPHDNPDTVEAANFRFDVCGELHGPLHPNDAGVIEKVIPGGRYAVARHIGSTDAIGDTVRSLYATWLPASGEQLRDAPSFFHYVKRMPSVPEFEQVTDVFLPLR